MEIMSGKVDLNPAPRFVNESCILRIEPFHWKIPFTLNMRESQWNGSFFLRHLEPKEYNTVFVAFLPFHSLNVTKSKGLFFL